MWVFGHTASSSSSCVTKRPACSTRWYSTANGLGVNRMRSSAPFVLRRHRHWLTVSNRNGGNSFIIAPCDPQFPRTDRPNRNSFYTKTGLEDNDSKPGLPLSSDVRREGSTPTKRRGDIRENRHRFGQQRSPVQGKSEGQTQSPKSCGRRCVRF